MDDFKENPQAQETEETVEESTVFSAPEEHNDKDLKSPQKRRITAVISAVLAVLILVGGTLAIIKYIPKLDDGEDTDSSDSNTITVINFDSAKYDGVTVKNGGGEFVFYPEAAKSDDSDETTINWYVKNIAKDKISLTKTGEIISAIAKIKATREITKKTFDECGLNNPKVEVGVKSKKLGNFTLKVGDISPDNTGVYLYSSVDEKIYLVPEDVYTSLDFIDTDLAGTDAVAALRVDTDDDYYFDGNGNLASFDKLELYGSKYDSKIVITPVDEKEGETVSFAYKVISPGQRYAETQPVTDLFNAFSTGITVSGVYSLDNDAKTQAKYGLNNPDAAISVTIDKKIYTYKFALQKDGYYAFCGDGVSTIKKIAVSDASFLDVKVTDIYNKLAYIRSISEIGKMDFKLKDKTYSFTIKENADDDEEQFTVYCGKKRIKSDYFQNFYMHFVSLSLADFSYERTGQTALTVTITDNGKKTETLEFKKASATEYYCSRSGAPLGKITASSFNKLLSDLETVSQNKDVGEN